MDANEPRYRLLNAISRLANHIINRNLSYWSRDALFVSLLTATRKKNLGKRPIAVDSVFRRIANKLAVQSVRTRVSEQLRPVQDGLGIAGGAEAAVHASRKFINNARPHYIMLKIDMRNAFSSLRRGHILEMSTTTCPGICRLMHCAYSTPSALNGIFGICLSSFRSYLSNRGQSIAIANRISPTKELHYDVSLGFVLGPILLVLCIQQLSNLIKRHSLSVHLFADDILI